MGERSGEGGGGRLAYQWHHRHASTGALSCFECPIGSYFNYTGAFLVSRNCWREKETSKSCIYLHHRTEQKFRFKLLLLIILKQHNYSSKSSEFTITLQEPLSANCVLLVLFSALRVCVCAYAPHDAHMSIQNFGLVQNCSLSLDLLLQLFGLQGHPSVRCAPLDHTLAQLVCEDDKVRICAHVKALMNAHNIFVLTSYFLSFECNTPFKLFVFTDYLATLTPH